MTPKQSLFYALGELAYAIASADGAIQKEEKKTLHQILDKEFKNRQWDFDYSEIIFQILEKDKTNLKTAYDWSLKEIKTHSDYLNREMKEKFVNVIEKVAEAFPPITKEERKVIYDFIRELNALPDKKVAL